MKKRLQYVLHFSKSHWWKFLILFTCIIATTFMGAAFHYLFGRMVDEVFYAKDMSAFIQIVIFYAIIYLINQGCKLANIYDFIDSLPQKYNTIIGEKGVKLSGGQRQRLALARTILLNPDIIVFDEATSALDYENEMLVLSSIKELSEEKTIVTVAHRLSTIKHANRVILIDEGTIVGEGTNEELYAENEIYKILFSGQIV